jgi:hypothetical protein
MKNLNFKQIAIGIVGLIAIVMGLMKSPTTENETVQQIENQESIESNTEIVEFNNQPESEDNLQPRQVTDDTEPGNQTLTYDGKELILTHHAKCRMDCREISKAEVREVIREGKENKRKSNPNDPRCPTIALEDWTEDGQRVRIIVADCDNVAKLVTVIDLENEYRCDCK